MNVSGKHYRTIWLKEADIPVVCIVDQRWLPHQFIIEDLHTVDEIAVAIKDMHVRGAGLLAQRRLSECISQQWKLQINIPMMIT
jgi:methylthioribose-1-phosphate isomerase